MRTLCSQNIISAHNLLTMLNKILAQIDASKTIVALDKQLLAAVFAPALKGGYFESSDLAWTEPTCGDPAEALIAQLFPLSEYYQERNPPLSAAIWGIGNALTYLRQQQSFLSIVFESKAQRTKAFDATQALIATAVIQFSDGNARTVITSNAMQDLPRYKAHVEVAMKNISSLPA